ncbi:MAG: response regulator transcription factor [Cytophagales bacterium]|uniref:LytTR family DNA-binding domain-containing protein n=1 Tax=Algoriphagus taiwanensis TaxID=1445656 RepID=A0ABQ6Q2W6_9BACT|nr:MAG: response regulator transcription factor [Cytophagales bacterium]GMQ33818.1 LytTR family DNA-binding domain-containing protein [Algoriphagus taiwanensis]
MKILIVEDDHLISQSVKDILGLLEHEVVGIADNANDAIDLCNNHSPDLALLDIQIAGDIDGVELAELIRDQFDIPFIFTTAYADNATISRAREMGPFGYLVKPYGVKEVNAAIQIAKASFDRLKKAEKANANMSKIIDNSLFLKVDSKLVKVKIEEILYIEAKGDYALFKTKTKGYIVHTTIKKVQDRLESFNFQKVHRSFVVNISKIVDIEESNLLIDDKVIPISRANKDILISRLNLL